MHRLLLITAASSFLLSDAALAQTPSESSEPRVWQMIMKATRRDVAATINPVLMTEDVCRAAITNFRVVLDDWEQNRGVCLDITTGAVFGPTE
jgi:hypothetical protein